MYGQDNTSEARQATAIGLRIPKGSLVIADAGFGIFRVAYAMISAGERASLFRVSKARFQSLHRRAEKIERTAHGVHYRLIWTPSPEGAQKRTRTYQTMHCCRLIFTR